jgi:hypothetical protein
VRGGGGGDPLSDPTHRSVQIASAAKVIGKERGGCMPLDEANSQSFQPHHKITGPGKHILQAKANAHPSHAVLARAYAQSSHYIEQDTC